MRTVLSAQAVARRGRVGCGADCHVRAEEGGWSVERWVSVCGCTAFAVGVGVAMLLGIVEGLRRDRGHAG